MSDDRKIEVSVNFWDPIFWTIIVMVFLYMWTDICKDKGGLPRCVGMYYQVIHNEFEAGKAAVKP